MKGLAFKFAMRGLLVLLGSVGTYLATDFPAVYSAICGV